MAIEKAPYLIYSEQVSTVNYGTSTGADVLAIIAPTKFGKYNSEGNVETEILYHLEVYSESAGTTLVGNCTCKLVADESTTHIKLQVTESDAQAITVGTNYFVVKTAKTDGSLVYELFTDAGTTSASKYAKVSAETVTKWYEPTVSEDEILIFNRYSVAEQMIQSSEVKKVLKEFFLENSYYSADDNLGVNSVLVIPIPTTTTGTGQNTIPHPNVDDFKDAYKLLRKFRRVNAIGLIGVSNPQNIGVTLKQYLVEDQERGVLRIAYIKAPERGSDETVTAYATRIANICQTHNEVISGDTTQVEGVNSSRICLVEPTHYGTLLAKICNTEYYLEPGYLPINSLSIGEFDILSDDERDKLCMSGLIFGEDDVILPVTVPRICLGVSTSFGRPYSENATGYESRLADSLLHARRNVDHHVREVLSILAYQIKRNETSVNLTYLKNQVMNYFEKELGNGTIMAYSFNVTESQYNPYCLLVTGEIVPVNSTLAIKFNNYIEAPYNIASNYV